MNLQFIQDKTYDLLINVIGVAFGSYLALYIAKFQLIQQSKQEKQKNDEISFILLNRCETELRDNSHLLRNKLIPILDLTNKPNELHYEWIKTISNSFQKAAYEDLLRLNLSHNLPKKVEGCLSSSYNMFTGLHEMIQVALAGFNYQDIYGGLPDYRQSNYDNIKIYSHTVLEHIENDIKEICKYTNLHKDNSK